MYILPIVLVFMMSGASNPEQGGNGGGGGGGASRWFSREQGNLSMISYHVLIWFQSDLIQHFMFLTSKVEIEWVWNWGMKLDFNLVNEDTKYLKQYRFLFICLGFETQTIALLPSGTAEVGW